MARNPIIVGIPLELFLEIQRDAAPEFSLYVPINHQSLVERTEKTGQKVSWLEPLKISELCQLSTFGEAEGETVYIPAEDEAEEVKAERQKSTASIPWPCTDLGYWLRV